MHLVHTFRKRYGWSINKLAQLAHLQPRMVWEIDKNPNYDFRRSTMIKIARAFGLSPGMLFFPEEELKSRLILSSVLRTCMENGELTEVEVFVRIHGSPRINNLELSPDELAASQDVAPRGNPEYREEHRLGSKAQLTGSRS